MGTLWLASAPWTAEVGSLESRRDMPVPAREEILSVMAENRRAFLSFLERRVGHRETAEDLLQESFARSLDKVPLEPQESVNAWFYRAVSYTHLRAHETPEHL